MRDSRNQSPLFVAHRMYSQHEIFGIHNGMDFRQVKEQSGSFRNNSRSKWTKGFPELDFPVHHILHVGEARVRQYTSSPKSPRSQFESAAKTTPDFSLLK